MGMTLLEKHLYEAGRATAEFTDRVVRRYIPPGKEDEWAKGRIEFQYIEGNPFKRFLLLDGEVVGFFDIVIGEDSVNYTFVESGE